MAMIATTADAVALNCTKIADSLRGVLEKPVDFEKLDADALDEVIVLLSKQLEVAQDVLSKKGIKPFKHVDSVSVMHRRESKSATPRKTSDKVDVGLRHVDSIQLSRSRLSSQGNVQVDHLHNGSSFPEKMREKIKAAPAPAAAAAVVVGALLVGLAFRLARRK